MMKIQRTVEIEVEFGTDELIARLESLGPIDYVAIIKAIAKTITDDDLQKLRVFMGDEAYKEVEEITEDLAIRVQEARPVTDT